MNCNPCCGCCPPITTYNPSVADSFPTILQQVEYLKALLKKYPSQQWFITQEKVTEKTVKLDSTKISLRGRAIAEGDFILGNKVIENEDGTFTTLATLMFQYTGATIEVTNYVVEFVGVYSEQGLAQQALDLAKTNEQDIAKLDSEMVDKVDKIPQGELLGRAYLREPLGIPNPDKFVDVNSQPTPLSLAKRDNNGNVKSNSAVADKDVVINADFRRELYKKQDKITDTTNLDARYISAVSAFRKVTLVGSVKTYDNIYFENGREVGDIYVLTRGNTKTLFGNKSLYGTGNIDLYHHEISYDTINDGITITVNFEHYSSNNLKADSLTDVKTLLGNTFKKGIFGSITNTATGKALTPLYINETNIFYIGEDGSVQNQSLAGNFIDTVTTI